eukprot:9717822-Heterocapsa_arctica.AAC.1
MLKELSEDLVREYQEEANKTRVIVRDLEKAMTKRREHSPMLDTGMGEQKKTEGSGKGGQEAQEDR